MIQKNRLFYIVLLLFSMISCEDTETQHPSVGIFSGKVTSVSGLPVYPIYIIEGDSLLSAVSKNNQFSIVLEEGEHKIIFSAIGYADTIFLVQINGDIQAEIQLKENKQTGRIYGELQDLNLFQQKVAGNKELATWSDKQIVDGVTGATIMEDNSSTNFEQAQLFIGDSLMGYADVYGQYWIQIQCGTYPLTAKSVGFLSETKLIKVLPDAKVYLNFFLSKK
jgi:hypothetical protein